MTSLAGERPLVRFVRVRDGAPESVYDVAQSADELVLVEPSTPGLSESETSQHRARRLALDSLPRRCTERYNTVALRGADSDEWLVWAMPATLAPDVLPMGGYVRFTISGDGRTVRAREALSQSCYELPRRAPGEPTVSTFTVTWSRNAPSRATSS